MHTLRSLKQFKNIHKNFHTTRMMMWVKIIFLSFVRPLVFLSSFVCRQSAFISSCDKIWPNSFSILRHASKVNSSIYKQLTIQLKLFTSPAQKLLYNINIVNNSFFGEFFQLQQNMSNLNKSWLLCWRQLFLINA